MTIAQIRKINLLLQGYRADVEIEFKTGSIEDMNASVSFVIYNLEHVINDDGFHCTYDADGLIGVIDAGPPIGG